MPFAAKVGFPPSLLITLEHQGKLIGGSDGKLKIRQYQAHGLFLGIACVSSTSRSIPPAIGPSRIQLSACHQSS